jgi:PKD repeat protein
MKIKNLLHFKIQENTLRLHSASTIHTESFGMTNSGTHENGTTQKKQDKIFILPLITLLTIVLFFNPQSYGHNFNNRSSAPSGPVITVGTLAPFENQCIHTASEIQSYIVSGTSLTGPIEITPPEGFEISPNGGVNFQPSSLIRLNPDASGSTPDVSIFVRFTPTGAQTYSDNITHTSSGADPQNVAVAGTGIAAPVADFTATPITVTAGGNVTFTDNSTNAPTSWAWSFPGGSPSSGTSQNPTVTYSTAGNYSVSLTAINDCGSDEETKTGYISVTNPCITPIATEPSTGDGSPGNPYQIATLENLYWIMADRTKWDKHYTQTANIDASSTVNWCTGGWLPIGDWYVNSSQGNVFSGSYDGKGHTISGLHVSNSKSVAFGLFGRAIGAVIKNIGITDVETTGVSGDAGALVGSASNCLIDNCYSTGTVAVNPAGSMYDAGGLVGILESSSNLSNSHSTCNVTGASSVGGLAGLILNYSTIKNCYYSGGTVDGSGSSMSATGGLVGVNDYYSSIQKCYSTGNVSGYDYSGGLVGSNSRNSLISNCFSRCTVSGNSSYGYNCGGLAGYNTENSQISKCYSTGAVGNLMGGLVGYNESGDVSDSYWDSQTAGTTWSDGGSDKSTGEMKTVSTFTGWDFATTWGMNSSINDGYPYLQPESTCETGTITLTSGSENLTICAGTAITSIVYTIGGGATDAKATGLPDGVTGSLIGKTFTISGTPTASGICEYSVTTTGTPFPCSEGTAYGTITVKITPAGTAPSGDGLASNPYQIATLKNLYWIAENPTVWNKYFIQTANIDASSTADWCTGGWLPIGLDWENYFSGNYDGRGHTISGLYIASSPAEANGLFGYAEGAAFQNLGITDVRINGDGSTGASGALLGAAGRSVSIKNCFSTGEVKGRDNCGGLVGAIIGNSVVANSYSTCDVIGNYSVGGLVGMSNMGNSIINCFHTTGTVVGVNSVGGLVGLNSDSSISKCYSTDKVTGDTHVGGLVGLNYDGTISDCYSRCTVTNTSTFNSCGGLVGLHDGSNANILNCYSTGSVITGMGGLIGVQDDGATTTHSFWDTQTSGTNWSADGEGKSTSEMKMLSNFTDAGWDFTTIWGVNAIFNDGYPCLIPVTLTLLSGSNLQTVCAGEEIIPIVYVADGFESGVYVTPESSSGFAVLIEPEAKKFTITGSFTDAGSYTYTVIAAPTLFPWVGATVTGTITVNESFTPSVTITSNDADNIICANTGVTFTATPNNTSGGMVAYQWYYYNKLQNILYDYDTWNANTWYSNELEDGDEIYCEITVTGNNCLTSPTATSDKITMEVYDSETRPSVTIESIPEGEICPGTNVIFTAIPENTEGGGVTYQWYYYNKLQNKLYDYDSWDKQTWWSDELEDGDEVYCEITVTDAACFESATASSNKITISVIPWPDAGMVTGENVIQVGQSTTLAADIPGGKWYCFETDIATVDETGNVTGEGAGTTTIYYVIVMESQCYDEAVTLFPITVTSDQCTNPTNGGEISGNQTVCSGSDPIPFTSTSEASGYHGTLEYKWQYSDVDDPYDWEDLSESNSAGFDDSQSTMSTRWYRRLARVACSDDWTGAAESNVLKVMVDEADVSIMIMGPTMFCEGGSVKLQASDASSYLWNNGETTKEIKVTTPGDYYVTITNGNGCSANTSASPVSVTVNPMPTISGISVDNEHSCYDPYADPTLTFSGLIPGENNIFYALNEEHINEPLELIADDKGNATHSFDLEVGTFVFSIDEIRVNGGCTIHPSENNSVSWTVYEIPEANAGSGGDVCGLGFDLAATPSAGTGTWTKESGPGTADFNGNVNNPDVTVTVDEYGTYIFKWTEENGSCINFDEVTVNFYQQPVADAGDDQSQCNNSTFTIGPSTKAAIIGPSGIWSFNGDNGGAEIEDIYSETTTVTNVPFDQDITLRWTLTNGTCTDFDDVVLRNNSLPEASPATLVECDHGFETADFTLTDADAVVIGAQTGVVLTYHATQTDADNDENSLASPYNSGSATVYARVETEATGCFVTSEVTLTAKPLPTLTSLTVDKEAICEDDELHEARVTITFGGLHNSNQNINVTFITNGNTEKALTGDEIILQSDLHEKEGSYFYVIQLDEKPGNYQIIVNSISANGCTTTYDENEKPSVSWVVYPEPTASISGDLEACGRTILTAITDASSASYIWEKLNGQEVIPIEGETGSTLEVTESGTYLVEITNTETGCIKGAKVEVTVRPQFTSGAIQTTGETICYNGDPGLIGSATAASGGDNVITYKWQADGSDIANSNAASYDPPAGLTAATTYTVGQKMASAMTLHSPMEAGS